MCYYDGFLKTLSLYLKIFGAIVWPCVKGNLYNIFPPLQCDSGLGGVRHADLPLYNWK